MKKNFNWKMVLCALTLIAVTAAVPMYGDMIEAVQQRASAEVLVLDPGHGGMDGGAVSSKGISEKDINLAIAMRVKEFAEKDGWNVIMTRKKDEGLYDNDEGSIRSMKTKDLKERHRIITEARPRLAVSVHLNSFKEDVGVHGAQVFYPEKNGEEEILEASKAFAEVVQEELILGIDDGTNRVAMSKGGVLILKRPVCPIIIVECGFLSNSKEASLLTSSDYQYKLAQSIYAGIMKYSGKKPTPPLKIIESKGCSLY